MALMMTGSAPPSAVSSTVSRTAFVGCFTSAARHAQGKAIRGFTFAAADAVWRERAITDELFNPSFLISHPTLPVIYSAHGDADFVSAFRFDVTTQNLRQVSRVVSGGVNGVHLAIDPSHEFLIVANYTSGSLSVLTLEQDGSLGDTTQVFDLPGEVGPHRLEQRGSHPHHVVFDPSGQSILVPDKGLDRIFSLKLINGTLKIVSEAKIRAGAGPRHIVFHPEQPIAFVVNEIDSTIAICAWDKVTAALTPLNTISTLPSDFFAVSSAAAIAVSCDGRHVYASNRGHDSIARFTFNSRSMKLDHPIWRSSQGSNPRFMTMAPGGDHLLVTNQNSHNIIGFEINHETGALLYKGCMADVESPSCIIFL